MVIIQIKSLNFIYTIFYFEVFNTWLILFQDAKRGFFD